MTKRRRLAEVAEQMARKPFHGKVLGLRSNLKPITDRFPKGPRSEFDGSWCAAFVYHCFRSAGFDLPPQYPTKAFGSFASVRAWLEWSKRPENGFYISVNHARYKPAPGDIIIYDNIFDPGPHDHIGIVIKASKTQLTVAEGNVNNLSAVVERPLRRNVRGLIRVPEDYSFARTHDRL
ncbi:MAG TPA: CHAP domain-containing protein [candidate division Zixibacteria bacterium]|nr:CHAP domain-containing protein [candidate division Zixibacteria bacterium]